MFSSQGDTKMCLTTVQTPNIWLKWPEPYDPGLLVQPLPKGVMRASQIAVPIFLKKY